VFLAVAGCLFALLISAYFMRTAPAETTLADWVSLPSPKLMWVNTAVLAVSSVALQGAVAAAKQSQRNARQSQRNARQSHRDALKSWLLAGGVTALAFLAGQLLAWRQLADAGWFLATNPSSSFFYLITGAHGLHVAGGLVALGRTMGKAWGGCKADRLRLSVELCAWYWHFLLLVWLIVFTLLTGWAGDFASVCRQLLS